MTVAGSRPQGRIAAYRDAVLEVWVYRELLLQLTYRDVRIRYKQAVMGFGWAILMPVLVVLSGLLIRAVIGSMSGQVIDSAAVAGIAVKGIAWAFFVGAIGFANTSLIGSANLVTKIYFPREVLPLAALLAQALDTLIGAAVLVVVLPILGVRPSVALLWVPILVLLLFLFTLAVALFVSCASLFFRDVKYLVQVLLTFGIFFTPVFYEPAMAGSMGSHLVMLNPLSPILEGLRLSVIEGHGLLSSVYTAQNALVWSPWSLLYSAGWAVFGLVGAAAFFHRLEFLFAEYA